ncbi:MAG: beta-lactamase family protein [Proteobacteria bacterium]|nr:beta-lactamase family protein [Pseudomonadota bacterium]
MPAWADITARIETQLRRRLEQPRIPCFDYAICHRGRVVAAGRDGWASVEERLPLRAQSLFRIFSMTKPITSVIALMLVDEGRIALDEPVARILPELGSLQVFEGVDANGSPRTRPAVNAITLRHLLTHTAGFTYHFMTEPGPDGQQQEGPIQRLYRARGIKPAAVKIAALPGDAAPVRTGAEMLAALGSIPLVSEPGRQFHYSVATDVVGSMIERLTGTTLGTVFHARLFEPLGMKNTSFRVQPADIARFTSNYRFTVQGPQLVDNWRDSDYLQPPSFESGGGGLVSTTNDYLQFLEMLRAGATSGDRRFLSPALWAQLCKSQLSPQVLAPSTIEVSAGTGFGLGLGIYENQQLANTPVASGSLFWNGAAGSCCWIDPRHDLSVVVMTQLLENDTDRLDRLMHREMYDEDSQLRLRE